MSQTGHQPHAFATNAIHADAASEFSSVPIYMTVTDRGRYTRSGNPTIDALEQQVARMEGADGAVATSCGVSAVMQTLLTLLHSGDRIICHRSVYTWVDIFINEEAHQLGIEAVQMDLRNLAALQTALQKPTKVVYFEPVSNSSMDVIDVQAVITLAHQAGATVVVDNTFLSPFLLQPLRLGADVVLHSATKYLNGHGDVLAGVVSGNAEFVAKLKRIRNIYGGILSPFNAFLVLRGMTTLDIRVQKHCANAQKVAQYLAQHPNVAEVRYPGLPSYVGHAIAAQQFNGFGGMMGFQVQGGVAAAEQFVQRLQIARPWVSLGDTKTLAIARPQDERKGIPDGYVRLSVGLEDVEDIISDLEQALQA